jgi:hypothetical protein
MDVLYVFLGIRGCLSCFYSFYDASNKAAPYNNNTTSTKSFMPSFTNTQIAYQVVDLPTQPA